MELLTLEIELIHPFATSQGIRDRIKNVVVRVTDGEIEGWGEAVPLPRFGDSYPALVRSLAMAKAADPLDLARLGKPSGLVGAARSGLEMALCDLDARRQGQKLHDYLEIPPQSGLRTSYTLGIDRPEVMADRAREACDFPILKLKLGAAGDRERFAAVRSATDRPLRVDVNEGWNDREAALAEIEALADQGVELIEQPLPAGRLRDVAWLRERSPLPIVADEDCVRPPDLERLVDAYDGVNLKLDKCGGLLICREMAIRARSLGLSVMVGCAGSSALSITAAAHLAQLADLADLDAHLLLKGDPFRGMQVVEGRIVLPAKPGIGVELDPERDPNSLRPIDASTL